MHEGRKNWKGRVSYMQLVSLHIFYRVPGVPAMGNGSYSRIDEQRQQQRRQYSFKEIGAFSGEKAVNDSKFRGTRNDVILSAATLRPSRFDSLSVASKKKPRADRTDFEAGRALCILHTANDVYEIFEPDGKLRKNEAEEERALM